jgi:chloramphenicol 3-O phosphotransferase
VSDSSRRGWIVILNGAPRSGKSSIVAAVQASFDGVWINLGVDVMRQATPPRVQPGLGLRPGGERPDLEAILPDLFGAFYEAVAGHSRAGLHVVVDIGHHDGYSRPLGLLGQTARQLQGLPALLVGVRCPIEVIMQRRDAGDPERSGVYESSGPDGAIPEAVRRWQDAVHRPGIYDLEVDSSTQTPEQCAQAIRSRLDGAAPSALSRLVEVD